MDDMQKRTPRIAVIAQARMGSSRLPGKVLKQAAGRSLLGHLVHRVHQAFTPFELVIATTDHASDDPIEEAASALGCRVFRGSEHDVLERYRGAAAAAGADVIARITGDCPLMDGAELDRVLSVFLGRYGAPDAYDYVTNQAGSVREIPRGLDIEVFSRSVLERAAREATDPGEREHVTPYLYNTPGRFRTLVTNPQGMSLGHLRLTVDTPADLALVTAVLNALGPDATVYEVAELLAERPDLVQINAGIVQRGVDSEEQQRRRRIDGGLLLARADRGHAMGSGHVARLTALLAAWVHLGGRARMIGAHLDGFWSQRLAELGVETEAGALDARAFLERADALEAMALATDGYQFDAEYIRTVARRYPTLSVDDLAEFPHVAHVVLNQNVGFDKARYDVDDSVRLLVGEKYVLLRPEFWSDADTPERNPKRVVMSFGSSDPAALTVPMVQALLETAEEAFELVVVAGPGMAPENRTQLELLTEDARLTVLDHVQDMAALFRAAPLALIAAGTTAWEAIACGTVPIAVEVAENQAVVTAGLQEHDAGLSLGWHTTLEPADCAQQIHRLQSEPNRVHRMAKNGKSLIDGRGVWRAVDALLDATEQWRARR